MFSFRKIFWTLKPSHSFSFAAARGAPEPPAADRRDAEGARADAAGEGTAEEGGGGEEGVAGGEGEEAADGEGAAVLRGLPPADEGQDDEEEDQGRKSNYVLQLRVIFMLVVLL